MIGQTHFSQISTNLYVDDSLDEAQQSNLIEAINDAIERVSNVYGNPISSPRIIATTGDQYSSFGFNPTGMQASGFFRECIFLGPKGLAYSGDGEHRFRFYREHLNSTHWVHDIFNLSVHDGQF